MRRNYLGPSCGSSATRVRSFLARRVISTLAGAAALTVLVFALIRLVPGDAVTLWIGQEGTMSPEVQETLRKLFGLNTPQHEQYLSWIGDVLRGDLGYSFRSRLPVVPLILQAVPVTLELAVLAMIISVSVALPLGILSAARRNGPLDLAARVLGLLGLSMPSFWIAVLLILASTTIFNWLPSLIYVGLFKDPLLNLQQMAMPAVALSLPLMGVVMRMTRSSMLEVLEQVLRSGLRQTFADLRVRIVWAQLRREDRDERQGDDEHDPERADQVRSADAGCAPERSQHRPSRVRRSGHGGRDRRSSDRRRAAPS